MKVSLKQALAVGALAVVSTSAFADISLPNSNNGELTLIVWDQTNNTSYVRGLGINLDTIATQAQVAGDASYVAGSTLFHIPSINLAADANLSTFLGAVGGSDVVSWAVIGGATASPASNAAGNKRYVSTTSMDVTGAVGATTNAKLTSQFSNLQAWDTGFSAAIEGDNGGNTTVGNGQSSTHAGFTSVMSTWSGAWSATNQVALGSSANLYLLSSNGGGAGTAGRVYALEGLTLSLNGTLTSAGGSTPPIPVPAAAWLLGSGLVGLLGIGRRKKV